MSISRRKFASALKVVNMSHCCVQARRRLQKKLYIPLPEFVSRRELLLRLLQKEGHNMTPQQVGGVHSRDSKEKEGDRKGGRGRGVCTAGDCLPSC